MLISEILGLVISVPSSKVNLFTIPLSSLYTKMISYELISTVGVVGFVGSLVLSGVNKGKLHYYILKYPKFKLSQAYFQDRNKFQARKCYFLTLPAEAAVFI